MDILKLSEQERSDEMKNNMLGITACTFISLVVGGCGVHNEPKEVAKPKVEKAKEPESIPYKYYKLSWGSSDKEWVYADDWVQHKSFASFEEANQVLDTCKKGHDTQTDANKTAVEQCVKTYLLKQNKKG